MFGLTSELARSPSEPQTVRERGRLRRGNALSNRKTVKELIHHERSLILPDITTTQLVQQASTKRSSPPVENPLSRTERRLLLRQGRLRDSWTSGIEEDLQKLGGLTGCGLSADTKVDAQSSRSVTDDDERVKRVSIRREKSRLSKPGSDSGFFDERLESVTSGEARTINGSADSEQHGGGSRPESPNDCRAGVAQQRHRRAARAVRPPVNGTRTGDELRNDEGTSPKTSSAPMDWDAAVSGQAAGETEADLSGAESFCSDKAVGRSIVVAPTPRSTVGLSPVHCASNVTKVKVERKSLSWPRQDVGISVALLKNRRKLLLRRSGSNHHQLLTKDATEACDLARVNVLVKSNTRATRRRVSDDRREESPSSDDDCPEGTSSVGLTKESVRKVASKEGLVDVNTKCEEWLNRWLSVTHPAVESAGLVES